MKPIYWILYGIGAAAVFGLVHVARDEVVMRAATAATGETPAQYAASKRPEIIDPWKAPEKTPATPDRSPSLDDIYSGKTGIRTCTYGFHPSDAPDRACLKDPDYFANRNLLGNCPTGYVDNPRDPNTCALPIVAARMLHPVE